MFPSASPFVNVHTTLHVMPRTFIGVTVKTECATSQHTDALHVIAPHLTAKMDKEAHDAFRKIFMSDVDIDSDICVNVYFTWSHILAYSV